MSFVPDAFEVPVAFAGDWPPVGGMSLADNLAELGMHEREFAARERFAYSVLTVRAGAWALRPRRPVLNPC